MNIISKLKNESRLGLILLAYIAFIALGMPDGLLGIAWPSLRHHFSIPLDALGSLLFFSTAGYLTSSFLSGRLISELGVGKVLAISCLLTGGALIGYTLVPFWWMMVILGLVAGLGAGAIDAGLNTYVAAHFGEGLMQWLHASYGIGITAGPIIMTFAISKLNSWQTGYRIVALFQIVLAVCFFLTLSIWKDGHKTDKADQPKKITEYKTPFTQTLLQPRVWLSLFQFFLYTGSEVALGTWAYSLLTESRNIDPSAAGLLAGSYWAMFTVGRILAGLYTKRVGVTTLVISSLSGALAAAVLLWLNLGVTANLIAVAGIGFAIAPIFPGLVSGTSRRVGAQFAANTIGMQMAAAGLGAASIPSLFGVLARNISLEVIPAALAVLFLIQIGLYVVAEQNIPSERI